MDVSNLPRVTGRHRNRALAEARRTKATELAFRGMTYQAIADELGYANRGTVHRIVQNALYVNQVESIDEHRLLELARLDDMHQVLWPKAMNGDVAAVNTLLKISERRCRMLGFVGYGTTSGRGRSVQARGGEEVIILW